MWDEFYDVEDFENEVDSIVVSNLITQTDKAFLFSTVTGDFWIPKSVVVSTHGNKIYYLSRFSIKYITKHLDI